jgi:hypothetical protein
LPSLNFRPYAIIYRNMIGSSSERTLWYCANLPDGDYLNAEDEERIQVERWGSANLISSLLTNGYHAPAVDIDLSSTLSPHNILQIQVPVDQFIMADEEANEGCEDLVDSGLGVDASYQRLGDLYLVSLKLAAPSSLIPSKTFGHNHLYVEQEMDWDAYSNALGGLAYLGIIQGGFYIAGHQRRMTLLRKTPFEQYLGQLTLDTA